MKDAAPSIKALTITWVLLCGSGITSASENGEIEKLPITGMMKVTNENGEVFYLSDDRRFVFRGEMIDLWKGNAIEADMSVTQKIDWDRNGVSIEKIGFAMGKGESKKALFLSPECDDCRELVRYVLEEGMEDLNIVLLSSSQREHEKTVQVWCAKNRVNALRTVVVNGQSIRKDEVDSVCDRFGLMLAEQAAMLFGIGQLPMYVDEGGMGHTGENAIYAMKREKDSS